MSDASSPSGPRVSTTNGTISRPTESPPSSLIDIFTISSFQRRSPPSSSWKNYGVDDCMAAGVLFLIQDQAPTAADTGHAAQLHRLWTTSLVLALTGYWLMPGLFR